MGSPIGSNNFASRALTFTRKPSRARAALGFGELSHLSTAREVAAGACAAAAEPKHKEENGSP